MVRRPVDDEMSQSIAELGVRGYVDEALERIHGPCYVLRAEEAVFEEWERAGVGVAGCEAERGEGREEEV